MCVCKAEIFINENDVGSSYQTMRGLALSINADLFVWKKKNRKRDEPRRAGATSASRRNSSGNTQSDLRIEWNEEKKERRK